MGFFIKETQSKRAKKSNLGVSKETLIKMGCRACPLRQEPEVLPSGANGDAAVYVLGDGPSPADVKKQRVFSGKVGKVVRHAIPFDYEDLVRYGTTVFKAVPDDKAPSDIAMQCCRPKVEDDIYQSGAKVVLGLGPTALKWASGETSMHNWRGRRFPVRIKDKDMWFFVTHHAKDTLPLRWGDQQKPSDDEKQADRDISHLFANYAVWPTPKVHTRDDWWQGVTYIDGRRGEADLKKLERTLEELSVDPVLGFDLETSGLRPYKEGFKILTASVSNGEDTVAFPLDHKDGWDPSLRKRAHKIFLKWLKNNSAKIAHNLSFEMEVVCVYYNDLQLSRSVKWHDTLAQAYVLDGRKGMNDLDTLVFLKFGFWIKDIFSGLDKSNLENADLETLLKYNALDAKYTKMLFSQQQLDVQDAGMEQVYWDQMRRIPTCVLTQIKGLPVDQGIVGKWEKKLQKEIDKSNRMLRAIPVVQRFEKEYGSFNPASNEHIGIILEKYIKSSEAKTKTGKVSTSKNVLENLDHPFGKYIIQMREAQKLKSTYNDSIRFPDGEYIWPDGKIHQNLNHALTETRRTSSSSPNCFPGYVEILTEQGFVRFDKLQKGAKVAQYDLETKHIDFCEPLSHIKHKNTKPLCHIKTKQQIDIVCTPDHTFYLQDRKSGKWGKYEARSYPSDAKQPQAGYFVGGSLSYSKDQLIVIAALQADGHIRKDGYGIEWAFSKRRKIDRITKALQNLGADIRVYPRYPNPDGRIWLRKVPEWLQDKKFFGRWILQLTKECFDFLAEEVWFWDGCYSRRSMFTSNEKVNADWVQILTALSGRRGRMRRTQTSAGNDHWWVDATNTEYSMTTNFTKTRVPYSGFVYCVTMPKGTIVVRNNGNVLVVGNCQNFPKRKFANIREQIVAPPGHWFLSVDYGQIEYRVIGMMSKDNVVVQALWEDYDVHMEWFEKLAYAYPTWVGGKKMIKDPDTRKKFRNKAKNEWVFPLFFGASFNGVCKYLGIPENFVRPVYDEFWDTFSGVKKWQNKLTNRYENEGYVETLTGFRRWAPISRNQLINAPVQGSASEIVIDGMNRLSERAIKEDWNLQPVLNIHDDLSFILPDDRLDDLFTSIIDEMLGCKFCFLNVPLLAEATIGRDWYKHDEVGNFRSDKWFS